MAFAPSNSPGERRVQVDHGNRRGSALRVAVDEREEALAEDVHPPGEHDEVGLRAQHDLRDLRVVVLSRLPWVLL